MANEIDKIGKGFLSDTGQVKDRQTLRAEDTKQTKSTEKTSEAEDSEDKSVSSALKPVRSRFNEDISSVVSVLNENDDNLKKADGNVKDQIKKAKELKQAIKDGDSDSADKKRAELQKLQEERDAIAEEIDKDNQRLAEKRVQTVSVGNKQKETFKLDKVKFEKSEKVELDDPKDVNKLIDSLESDKEAIKVQRQEIKEVKKEVKTVLNEGRKELNAIEKDSIQTAEDAQSKADKVASDIVKAGTQGALVSNINETVVKNLLAA